MERVLILGFLCVLFALGQMNPPDVENVIVDARTETELTLRWKTVLNISHNYTLQIVGFTSETIPVKELENEVIHKVSSLSSGTKYYFILYTESNGSLSNGYNFSAVTAPSNVVNVSVFDRKEKEMTLQWGKVNNSNDYTYELNYSGGEVPVNISNNNNSLVEFKVTSLSPGTEYSFTLYTVFENVKSSGHDFSNVTVPSNVESVSVFNRKENEMTLQWGKVNNNNNYTYKLNYSGGEVPVTISTNNNSLVELKVSSLSPGTEYSFTLYTVFQDVESSGHDFSNVTMPSNVEHVVLVEHNDTDVILQWNVGSTTYNYSLECSNKTCESSRITIKGNESHISGLIPATSYSFTLYTEFVDLRSTGFIFNHTTTLSNVTEVRVTRSQKELTITWNKLHNSSIYNYTLSESRGSEIHFSGSDYLDNITHTYSSLTPGTIYHFTLFTVVNNVRTPGYRFKNVTTLNCESFKWIVTNSSINADVNGCTHVTAENSTGIGKNVSIAGNMVNLQDLYPGDFYNVSLWYILESESLLQCSHPLRLSPNSVSRLYCDHISGGYGLAVIWDRPYGVVDVVQVDIDGKSFNRSSNESQRQEVKSLQVAKWYSVRVTSFSGAEKSKTESINCQTNPAGVIAGVLVFFLLVIICVAIFIWYRYGSSKWKKSSKQPESKGTNKKNYRPIPVDTFPEHFQKLSCDENRGFSEEYEDLSSVGIDQSTAAALLPENKDKNRFSNVLPYDLSRVHLTVNDEEDSDYINANYMPGYGNASRQYIAAQGPLPSTVNDFWRMVWEKRSQSIVMVTNCTESGRVKCEQYWPLDNLPCLYGNLVVTMKSDDKGHSWTLREFNVKNKNTSETRTVKHFHFTAWPDHGVPFGTEELIKFRGLVRQHMESTYSAGPTVVHCSAGVGRTGTLIALDILLQQLDREKAVGIAAVVQQMRLCRPLMVQTESQYVFLHQCIMDSLQSKSEPLYENTDMIYANAIALKQYDNGSSI